MSGSLKLVDSEQFSVAGTYQAKNERSISPAEKITFLGFWVKLELTSALIGDTINVALESTINDGVDWFEVQRIQQGFGTTVPGTVHYNKALVGRIDAVAFIGDPGNLSAGSRRALWGQKFRVKVVLVGTAPVFTISAGIWWQ
jgi:hypothetical protein